MSNQESTAAPTTFGPYSTVRQAGNTYYISGQIGVDPVTHRTNTVVTEQVDQALKNLGAALSSVGLDYDDVVKTTLYLTDMGDFSAVNDIYVSYFNEPRPARVTVGVAELPRVGNGTPIVFEIEAIATREQS